MEMLNYSLWFTLGLWWFYITIVVAEMSDKDMWRPNARLTFIFICPPMAAILLEYLLVR